LEKNEDETVPAGDAAAPVANVAPDAQLPVDELHSASVTHAADDSQPTPTDSMGFQQFKERALTQRAELNREEKKAGRRGQRQTATAAPEPVHAVLTERARLIVDRIHADAVPGEQAVTVPEPASPAISAQRRGRPPGSREEREHLTAYLMDWLRQFNDQAPVSSISRALNDFRAANVPCERWGDYLHQAKSILRENQAKVTTKAVKQTNNLQSHNLTPYYFEILEDLLGLREGTNQTTAIVHSP
jgi:hypothetical protein